MHPLLKSNLEFASAASNPYLVGDINTHEESVKKVLQEFFSNEETLILETNEKIKYFIFETYLEGSLPSWKREEQEGTKLKRTRFSITSKTSIVLLVQFMHLRLTRELSDVIEYA